MADERREAVRAAKWPFVLGDALLLGTSGWVAWALHEGRLPWGTATAALVVGGVAAGAWVLATPFLRDHDAETRWSEQANLADTLQQVRWVEAAAAGIAASTGHIQSAQQSLDRSRAVSEEVATRLGEERRALAELQSRTLDQERQTMRIELEKLHRGEEETIRVLCHLLDHNYAVYQAGQRSGQPALAQQLGQYRAACLDAVRRLGLAAHEARPGEAFDPSRHEPAEGQQAGPGAVVTGTMACGYTFRGMGIRPIIVAVGGTSDEGATAAGGVVPDGGNASQPSSGQDA